MPLIVVLLLDKQNSSMSLSKNSRSNKFRTVRTFLDNAQILKDVHVEMISDYQII